MQHDEQIDIGVTLTTSGCGFGWDILPVRLVNIYPRIAPAVSARGVTKAVTSAGRQASVVAVDPRPCNVRPYPLTREGRTIPVVDFAERVGFPKRPGITGKWLCGRDEGTAAVSVLANTGAPGAGAPMHCHVQEEIVLVQAGQFWVEFEDRRVTAVPGQMVIIPPAWGNAGEEAVGVLFIWPMLDPFAPGVSA
jgi:quercetin dioxygenase-like cupin family protein